MADIAARMIIGARRCGTTMIRNSLAELHPDVAKPDHPLQEEGRLARAGVIVRRYYIEQVRHEHNGGRVIVVKAPIYLQASFVPARAAEMFDGKVRVLILLRDPVERAYSDWGQRKAERNEWRPFVRAIQSEPFVGGHSPDTFWMGRSHLRGYLERSMYDRQVARWLATLGEDNVMVMWLEDFLRSPHTNLQYICDFFGLDPARLERGEVRAWQAGEKRERLPLHLYDSLSARLKPYTYFSERYRGVYVGS